MAGEISILLRRIQLGEELALNELMRKIGATVFHCACERTGEMDRARALTLSFLETLRDALQAEPEGDCERILLRLTMDFFLDGALAAGETAALAEDTEEASLVEQNDAQPSTEDAHPVDTPDGMTESEPPSRPQIEDEETASASEDSSDTPEEENPSAPLVEDEETASASGDSPDLPEENPSVPLVEDEETASATEDSFDIPEEEAPPSEEIPIGTDFFAEEGDAVEEASALDTNRAIPLPEWSTRKSAYRGLQEAQTLPRQGESELQLPEQELPLPLETAIEDTFAQPARFEPVRQPARMPGRQPKRQDLSLASDTRRPSRPVPAEPEANGTHPPARRRKKKRPARPASDQRMNRPAQQESARPRRKPVSPPPEPARHGSPLLTVLLVFVCLGLGWLVFGLMMRLGVVPPIDLGYVWFDTNVYPLF